MTHWIKSHQVFHEPDLEQLAQINFFVEDFGLRGRLLFLSLWHLYSCSCCYYYQSVDYIFFWKVWLMSVFFFFNGFSFEGWRCQLLTSSVFLCTVFFSLHTRLFLNPQILVTRWSSWNPGETVRYYHVTRSTVLWTAAFKLRKQIISFTEAFAVRAVSVALSHA